MSSRFPRRSIRSHERQKEGRFLNAIDIIVIGIIALCTLFGLYRGFIQSVLNLAGGLLAFVGSFLLFPTLADVLSSNTDITRIISTYTDSGSLLPAQATTTESLQSYPASAPIWNDQRTDPVSLMQ